MTRTDLKNALVVGAGPAGSVAALLLARAGIQVTLVDAGRFPRDKVCGECLSALGLATLRQIGLGPVVRDAIPLLHTAFVAASGRRLDLNLPVPMAGLSRHAMDVRLLRTAETAGAEVRTATRCDRVDAGIAELRSIPDGAVSREAFDVILLADGKGAFPDATGRLVAKPAATADLGIKRHLTGVDWRSDTIALFGLDGGYAGLAPVEGGRFNLACGVPADRLREVRGDLDAWLRWACQVNPALGQALAEAEPAGNWLTCPLPRFAVQREWPQGIVPLGNAAAALEPVGGEGMGLAIASAALAVEALLAQGPNREALRNLRRAYSRLWRIRRLACRSAAVLLSNRRLASPVLAAAAAAPPVVRGVAWLMGKASTSAGMDFREAAPSG